MGHSANCRQLMGNLFHCFMGDAVVADGGREPRKQQHASLTCMQPSPDSRAYCNLLEQLSAVRAKRQTCLQVGSLLVAS
jgi:hypothetical protein